MNSQRRHEFDALIEWAASTVQVMPPCRQLSDSDLITQFSHNNLLSCQCAYMILLRTFAVLLRHGLLAEPLARRGELTLEEILLWRRDPITRPLYEAYCTYPDRPLIGLMAVLRIDEARMDFEWARRLGDKPVTQEFIRLDWLEEDRSTQVKRLLKVDRITSYQPWEQDEKDLQQSALLKAIELWRTPGRPSENPSRLPSFPLKNMLPQEREFWEGPMARAWANGHGTFLGETLPVLAGEKESIPQTVRDHRRTRWDMLARRRTLLAGQEEFPPGGAEASRSEWDWADPARRSRQEEIASHVHSVAAKDLVSRLSEKLTAERLHRVARKRWGAPGQKFLEALEQGKDVAAAAEYAGISRPTAYKRLKTLKETI